MYREWLLESLEKTKRSQMDLARATGLAPAIINRMVLGKRAIRDHEILALSKALGILPPAVPKAKRDAELLEVELVPVIGVAQDGVWRDVASVAPRPKRTELPCPPSPDFAGLRQAVEVLHAGDCDDGCAMPVHSEYLIFVPIEHIARPLRDGDHVFAEVTADRFHQFTSLRCKIEPGKAGTFVSVYSTTAQPAHADQVKVVGLVDASLKQHRSI